METVSVLLKEAWLFMRLSPISSGSSQDGNTAAARTERKDHLRRLKKPPVIRGTKTVFKTNNIWLRNTKYVDNMETQR
jgi:hypothetical protein